MKLNVRVTDIWEETLSVKRFCLSPANGEQLPPFSGGAHITTYLKSDNSVLERHYSLISNPRDRSHYQIAVRLQDNSRGGSAFWHQRVQVGHMLQISYPKNHFSLSTRAKHHVLCAAGIGITPFLSMMQDLEGKSFELHMAAPSRDECPFYEHILRQYPSQANFYFSREGQRLTPEFLSEQRMGTHVYVCGPDAMVKQFTAAARSYGYPAGNIHFERFAPPVIQESKPFVAQLNQSNRSITVSENESLLDVLLREGVKVPYSCRVGRCGTCQLEVLEGEVAHYDLLLSDAEKESQRLILPCVSRARSERIVLSI
ncbi:PDR/VanB family oxidoreductase [Brevibacillus sp. H7]|uniref:PDR/VanB family oxidoreductase n=1 Tax=Brevibacillus sp. H7 TaxID=3349138 RepID=UPI00380C31FA